MVPFSHSLGRYTYTNNGPFVIVLWWRSGQSFVPPGQLPGIGMATVATTHVAGLLAPVLEHAAQALVYLFVRLLGWSDVAVEPSRVGARSRRALLTAWRYGSREHQQTDLLLLPAGLCDWLLAAPLVAA